MFNLESENKKNISTFNNNMSITINKKYKRKRRNRLRQKRIQFIEDFEKIEHTHYSNVEDYEKMEHTHYSDVEDYEKEGWKKYCETPAIEGYCEDFEWKSDRREYLDQKQKKSTNYLIDG